MNSRLFWYLKYLYFFYLLFKQLSPGVYQYKFIVDGEWRFSPNDPTYIDPNENVNNVIDLMNYDVLFNKNYSELNTFSHNSSTY